MTNQEVIQLFERGAENLVLTKQGHVAIQQLIVAVQRAVAESEAAPKPADKKK